MSSTSLLQHVFYISFATCLLHLFCNISFTSLLQHVFYISFATCLLHLFCNMSFTSLLQHVLQVSGSLFYVPLAPRLCLSCAVSCVSLLRHRSLLFFVPRVLCLVSLSCAVSFEQMSFQVCKWDIYWRKALCKRHCAIFQYECSLVRDIWLSHTET